MLAGSIGRCVPSVLPLLSFEHGVSNRAELQRCFGAVLATFDLSRPLPPLKAAQRAVLALVVLLRAAQGADLGVVLAGTASCRARLAQLCERASITVEELRSLPTVLAE